MADRSLTVVFVHGWSVTHTNTYGELPERLAAEARGHGLKLSVRDIWLGEYVSFHDEVRMEDLALGVEAAVRRDLADLIKKGQRFAAITHSTGGPVMREWLARTYGEETRRGRGTCPMSHLVMLAPANFGSALAQLGKSRVSRLKNWFAGTEPGQGVLDWLELGSPESWSHNEAWIRGGTDNGVHHFVLTGQTIDRKLYDALNSYTGELGSDGVVRVAAANLNASYVKLVQAAPKGADETAVLQPDELAQARPSAFRVISKAAHSGRSLGIMRSVREERDAHKGREVTQAILRCLAVEPKRGSALSKAYKALSKEFVRETAEVQERERAEEVDRLLLQDRIFFHDRMTQAIFRVRDENGNPVDDFDLVLTGNDDDPNQLPRNFFLDRQRNSRARNTITYFLNYDVMAGCGPVHLDGEVVRGEQPGVGILGLWIRPRPVEGFVHFAEARLRANKDLASAVLRPNETVLIDIVLRRIVHEGVVRFASDLKRGSFKRVKPGAEI